ncbi:MAG: YihY/virulence factor BrkB family protein [Deltaproteobacteria bacterium]|nr:YihY/virulence factor BrkB family protein [Deltaproteobacteria bacterium]
MEEIRKAVRFVRSDLWRVRSRDLPPRKSFLIRWVRIFALTLRGVSEDRATLRASALTFYSLLSIVPVVAMIFGIAKGFGFQRNLEHILFERFEGQEQVVERIVHFAQALLENVKGGLVAGVGLIILFYTIIKILSHIENAFNDIWGIRKPRSLGRKITDYLSLMLITPVLFILSSTLTVTITSGARLVVEKISLLGPVSPLIFFLLKFMPYCVLWILFTFLYTFIPNTRVNFRSGVLAGIIAGSLYQVFQWVYITFQIGVAKYNAIYGSFAALPLFFIWLQFSWLIVLLGAEISFAHQNVETYEFEQDCLTISPSFKRLLSLRVIQLLVKHFAEGERAWSAEEIAHKLEIPIRLVQQILFDLVNAGLVSETLTDGDRAAAYQPARDPEIMTITYVLGRLEHTGSDNIPVAQSRELSHISESLKAFGELIEKSPENRLLREI